MTAHDRLPRALADRYRIEREIGQGGMATVYLAHDIRHDRKVALKVLKPELVDVPGGERFLREIRTTANLQHPHILPLFDSGSSDGLLYYVMPFVEGESLRARMDRERQLAIADAIAITRTIGTALDFAHRHGIIHRDIKPDNILLQDGVAVVADFGIAVAVQSAGGERLTETGISIGTPSYMSPEQISGERDVDARSDVYALACVTYEMLAGDPPFMASNRMAVMAKHMMDPAPSIATTRPNVSSALATAIARALNKAPADRFASAGAFAAALTAEPVTDERSAKSVVVLPFVNQSADADNDYFVNGLTEEIIADLSRLRGLRVISRNSSMALKGTSKDTATIARELKVSHVVTGSVRRADTALRVNAELVDAASDTSLWNDRFSGMVEDVFAIQEEIARKIVSGLEVSLSAAEQREVAARPIDDVLAYDYYLRARQEFNAWTPGSLERATELVTRALEIVGDNPLLLATLGQINWLYVNVSVRPEEKYLDQAADLAQRALAIDAEHYLGIFVRGLVAALRGQTERALVDLYRAHTLQPGDSNVRVELCRFSQAAGLQHYGRYVEEQIRVDPLTAVSWFGPSFTAQYNGRFLESVPATRRALELAGPRSPLHIYAAWNLSRAGLRDEAVAVLRQTGSELAGNVNAACAHFLMHALTGDHDSALAHITTGLETAAGFLDYLALILGEAHALIGRTEDAIRWTRTAVRRGFINYPYLAQHSQYLNAVRPDARFQQLLADTRPRWEAVVAWEQRL